MRQWPCERWAVAAFAVTLAASAAQAQSKAPAIVGTGGHTYEWVGGFVKLPAGMTVGHTHGDVVVDSKDRIYFSTETTNTLYQVDPDGRVARVFGHAFQGGAHGLRLVKEAGREVIWIAHTARHEVIKIGLDGAVLMTLTFPGKDGMYKNDKEFLPTAVDVAPNGDVYAVDGYGRFWLHRWNARGEPLQSWNGSAGAGPFREPHGVGIDTRGREPRVVVADRQNSRLQLFTLDGKYLGKVEEDLRLPSKVVVRGDDMLIVDLKGRITIFDRNDKVLAQLGDNSDPSLRGKHGVAPEQWRDGEFISPHGAAWDSKGDLYVQDWNAFGRVSKLKRIKGKPLAPLARP